MSRAMTKCRHHVKAANTARRALAILTVKSDNHRWPMEALDDARRDDAQHAGMPSITAEHQGIRLARGDSLLGLRQCFGQNIRFYRAPFTVVRVEFFGNA